MRLKINLYEVVDNSCRNFFSYGKVHVKVIFDTLLKYDEHMGDIENFCRLYILLSIYDFLLPNKNGIVFPILFGIVDTQSRKI